ncbi:MAG: nuclear transport factor 2 family protein [Acidobacteriota bacterium]
MQKLVFLIVVMLSVAVSGVGQKAAGASKPDPAQGVRDAFDRLVEGIRQVDAAKVMSVYDKSDRTLFFSNNGTATLGWEQMRANRESSYAKTKNVSLEITGQRVDMLGPAAAYVSCKWKQSQEFDGALETASGRMTLIFKKIGKDWKVVHLHTSPDNPPAARPVLPSERDPEKVDKPAKPGK